MELFKLFGLFILITSAIAIPAITKQLRFADVNEYFQSAFNPSVDVSAPLISNGLKASVGEFPWHASISVKYLSDEVTANHSYCSGAILNENWIIATADCISNAKFVRVDVGSIEIDKPAVRVYPDAFTVHPKYESGKFKNNIALLRLSGKNVLKFSTESAPNYAPFRLPQKRQENETFAGYEAYFSGFGDKAPKHRNLSEHLNYAEQRVIPNEACLGFFDSDVKLVTDNVVCSMSVDMRQGACVGDAGAPLVINEYGTHTLIGLLSFNHRTGNCGQQPVPTAFVRIISHLEWIRRVSNYQIRP